MNNKNKLKAIVAIAIALVFVMPVAAVANDGTIGVTSDSENASGIENIVETFTDNDIRDNTEIIEIASDDEIPFDEHEDIEDPFIEPTIEDPVIDPDELSIVIDDTSAVLATGNTTYVDDDANSSWYDATHVRTIHEGIANSTAGDNVYIYNGTYIETNGVTVNKQLDIAGESRENVTMDVQGKYKKGIYITSNNVNISTLTVRNMYYSAIYVLGYNNINIKNCDVTKSQYSYGSIYVKTCSNINIINCNVYDNKYTAMYIYASSYVDIINCNVYDNGKYGIDVQSPVNPTRIINCTAHDNYYTGIQLKYYFNSVAPFLVKNCTVYNSTMGSGIFASLMKGGDIIDCTVYNTYYSGISIDWNPEDINIKNCTSHHNRQKGIELEGLRHNVTDCTLYNNSHGIFMDASKCYLARNTMYDNTYNFVIDGDLDHIIDPTNTVGGLPIYWLNGEENRTLDKTYIFGILGLVFCNNITVKDNTAPEGIFVGYTTNSTLYNMSMRDIDTGFYIYASEYINIEKCSTYNTNVGFHLKYTDHSEITDCIAEYSSDKGFHIYYSPYDNLTNCIAHDGGYGFYIGYQSDYVNVVNCEAYNCSHGIAAYSSPDGNYVNCYSHHNNLGIYLRSRSTVVNCTVHDSKGIGIECDGVGSTWTNCTSYNNGAGGIAFYRTSDLSFTNCTSYNNEYGLYVNDARDSNFLNCVFYNNSKDGININYLSGGHNLTNCKSYNNTNLLDDWGKPIGYGLTISDRSPDCIVTDCDVYNNNRGIYIAKSPNSKLRGNTISNINQSSFDVTGSVIADFYQDIDTSNTIDGKTIYYLLDKENMTLDETSNVGYLRMVSCDNITAQNLDILRVGMMMLRTTNSTLSNVDVHDGKGIHLWESSDNDVTGCDVYNNTGHGIYLQGSPSNSIVGCTIYNNTGHGIYLLNSPYTTIGNTGCTVYENNYGIYISASPDTTITSCTVDDNNYGIYISASANNILRNNILTNNIIGFGVAGVSTDDFFQDIDESNTIDGDPIWYLVEDSDRIIDGSATFGSFGYLILVACDNMTLQNLDGADLLIILTTNSTFSNISAHHGVDGIYLWDSSYNDVIECTAYNNTGNGIYIRGSYNNNVTNCMSYNNGGGVYLSGSPGNIIKFCNAYNNSQHGIYLTGSSYNDFTQCNGYNNGNDGFRLTGSSYNDFTQCNAYNNGNNGFYLTGSSYNDLIQCDAYSNNHGFYLIGGSTWNNIMSSDIYGNSNYGAYLKSSNNNNIVLCNSYSNKYGFYLDIVSYCNIEKCDIYDNSNTGIYGNKLKNSNIKECNIYNDSSYGIYLYYDSSYNVIEKCDLSHSTYGIYIYSRSSGYPARYNTIDDCKIHDNTYGIWFGSSYSKEDYNTIVNCDIYNNNNGIYYKGYYTKYNKVYHNTLVGNTLNAYTYKTPNYWDDGYPSGGNYWDDYSGFDNFSGPDQNIPGSDGIGDTPYVSGKVVDNYPLMSSIQIYYGLNISVVGSGTTTPAEGVYVCLNGTVVNLEAFPDPGWEFTNWSGDITTTDNPTNITMDGNKTVIATFTQLYYNLTISVVGNGTTTPAPGVHSYLSYTVVPLEAFPDSSWEFAGWSGDINTMDNPTTITMDDHKAVTATYIYRPVISDVTLTNSTPMDTEPGFGWEKVTCTVTDNVEVGDVKLVVVYPNASIMEFDMIKDGDTYSYNTTFTDAGDYTYHIWANDTSDNENTSTPEIFTLYPNWDVDMNGVIRIQDFGAVAGHYGEDGQLGWIREDVDNNGAIRIQDFGAIAGHYGE